jgi:hypothetical protein
VVAPGSVSNADLMHNLGLAGSPSPDLGLAVTQGQGIKTTASIVGAVDSTQVVNRNGSISNSSNTTAPGTGAAIATLAVFDFYYRVEVVVGFGATAESTAIDNFQLKAGATVIATIPVVNVANTQSQVRTFYVNPGGSVNLTVNAISAGSAGAVYKASITATRL